MKSRKARITAVVLAVVMLLGAIGGVMILPGLCGRYCNDGKGDPG